MLKNFKNDKGVSLILLGVVIIVMLILFVVTFSTAKELIDSTKAKKYATVMYMIQGEITNRQDEAEFLSDNPTEDSNVSSIYIGTQMDMENSDIEDMLMSILITEVNPEDYRYYYDKSYSHTNTYNDTKKYWYILTKSDLEKVGIDTDFANNDTNVFLVNYKTREVIYTPGMTIQIEDPITGEIVDKKVYTLRTYQNL